jgi:hypothetical protein
MSEFLTVGRVNTSQIKTESAALGDALRSELVNDRWVASKFNSWSDTHQPSPKLLTRACDSKLLGEHGGTYHVTLAMTKVLIEIAYLQ